MLPGEAPREPILNPVDRIAEMLFGLFMALTFIGAVTVAGRGQDEVRTLFIAAFGCNLAWGLVDAVMYLVCGPPPNAGANSRSCGQCAPRRMRRRAGPW